MAPGRLSAGGARSSLAPQAVMIPRVTPEVPPTSLARHWAGWRPQAFSPGISGILPFPAAVSKAGR